MFLRKPLHFFVSIPFGMILKAIRGLLAQSPLEIPWGKFMLETLEPVSISEYSAALIIFLRKCEIMIMTTKSVIYAAECQSNRNHGRPTPAAVLPTPPPAAEPPRKTFIAAEKSGKPSSKLIGLVHVCQIVPFIHIINIHS